MNFSYRFFIVVLTVVSLSNLQAQIDTINIDLGSRTNSLIYPNGGEKWEVGKTPSIKWDGFIDSEVDLEYSVDGGMNWKQIASGIADSLANYDWLIPDDISKNALLRILDANDHTIGDTSNAAFEIIADNGKNFEIVVLGSSTAAGYGPSVKDSAWVWMYKDELEHRTTDFTVTNLAKGGYTTYNLLPTGFEIPDGVTKAVDPERNITKGLSLFPEVIIINLPTNDTAMDYPLDDQMANYATIAKLAKQFGVSLWVTTPQPKEFNKSHDQVQLSLLVSTINFFGDKTIDFWNGIFKEGSYDLKDEYNSGDGTHVNNAGHKVFLNRVLEANIDEYLPPLYDQYLYTSLSDIILPSIANSSKTLLLHSDVKWAVEADQDWVEIDMTSGVGDGIIKISISSENTSDSKREAKLTFKSSDIDDVVVGITQLGVVY